MMAFSGFLNSWLTVAFMIVKSLLWDFCLSSSTCEEMSIICRITDSLSFVAFIYMNWSSSSYLIQKISWLSWPKSYCNISDMLKYLSSNCLWLSMIWLLGFYSSLIILNNWQSKNGDLFLTSYYFLSILIIDLIDFIIFTHFEAHVLP